jgi:uncharacterized protein
MCKLALTARLLRARHASHAMAKVSVVTIASCYHVIASRYQSLVGWSTRCIDFPRRASGAKVRAGAEFISFISWCGFLEEDLMRTWLPVVASLGLSLPAATQQPSVGPASMPPQIAVSGVGETRVTPDRAIINIGVFSRATTAATAARENARKQQGIIDTLRALGIPREQISTTQFNVQPEMRHIPQSGRNEITGYSVNNTVRVEVRQLGQVAAAIDAALGKGANQINSLDFVVFNADEPRRRALAQAIERARLDAEAMARAAGGSLGTLLELSTAYAPVPVMRRDIMMATAGRAQADVATPIEPGEEMIRAVVTARWQFVPGGR